MKDGTSNAHAVLSIIVSAPAKAGHDCKDIAEQLVGSAVDHLRDDMSEEYLPAGIKVAITTSQGTETYDIGE